MIHPTNYIYRRLANTMISTFWLRQTGPRLVLSK